MQTPTAYPPPMTAIITAALPTHAVSAQGMSGSSCFA